MSSALRTELPDLPKRLARLPVARGYPVPWFVAWIDGEPDFRVIGPGKIEEAVKFGLCWLCGLPTGRNVAYVIGPMCAVNRVSAEPPSHRDCAVFAAQACPFLSRPGMRRREGGLPEDAVDPAGIMLTRNPGVTLVWVTHGLRFKDRLFDVGEPDEALWYCEGRPATRREVMDSIESGMPALRELASAQGPRAERQLDRQLEAALWWVP